MTQGTLLVSPSASEGEDVEAGSWDDMTQRHAVGVRVGGGHPLRDLIGFPEHDCLDRMHPLLPRDVVDHLGGTVAEVLRGFCEQEQ